MKKQDEPMKTFLTQEQLGQRWCISPKTLRQWRLLGWGPQVHLVGSTCLYDLDAVEAWEGGAR